MIIVITADYPVVIDNRHDHFERRVPVRRIVFGFIIVIKIYNIGKIEIIKTYVKIYKKEYKNLLKLTY